LEEVENLLESCRREVANLKIDMLELQDKTQRWMHRTIARQRAEQRELDTSPVPTPAGSGGLPTDPISEMLLRRRQRPPLNTKLPTDEG
jgi:hypothetical protein